MIRGKDNVIAHYKAQKGIYWKLWIKGGDYANKFPFANCDENVELTESQREAELERVLSNLQNGNYCLRFYNTPGNKNKAQIETLFEITENTPAVTGTANMVPVGGILTPADVEAAIQKARAEWEKEATYKNTITGLQDQINELKNGGDDGGFEKGIKLLQPYLPALIDALRGGNGRQQPPRQAGPRPNTATSAGVNGTGGQKKNTEAAKHTAADYHPDNLAGNSVTFDSEEMNEQEIESILNSINSVSEALGEDYNIVEVMEKLAAKAQDNPAQFKMYVNMLMA